jgi:hypothetical protein
MIYLEYDLFVNIDFRSVLILQKPGHATNRISRNKEGIIWDIPLRASKPEVLLKPWRKSGYLKT